MTAHVENDLGQQVLARDRYFSRRPLAISGQPLFAYSPKIIPAWSNQALTVLRRSINVIGCCGDS